MTWKTVWMFVVMGLVMAGCATEPSDECSSPGSCVPMCTADTDCAPGQRCATAAGQCVAKVVDRALTCTNDSNCLSLEICHPKAKACVKPCTDSTGCPDTTNTCAQMIDTDGTRVCQCSTDAQCNQGREVANLVCSTLDKVCVPMCTVDANCGVGRTCDTASGQCKKDDDLRCSIDADCLEAEICHPLAKVCVQTCAGSVDCPSSAKTCVPLSATDTRKVCQCSTDALCNFDRDPADLVCSTLDRVCAPKCTTNADCGTGRTCDTATGQCKGSSSGGTGAACIGEGQSSCTYGTHFCSASQCAVLPPPSCQNYTNFPNKSSLGTTGRILYDARVVSAALDTAYCGTSLPKRVRIALSAYSSTPFPQTQGELTDFSFVRVNGSSGFGADMMTVSGSNRERAELIVSQCVDSSSTTYSAGYSFTNGNFLCFQANYL